MRKSIIDPRQEQQEKLLELGAKLKDIRTEQGLSMEQIAKNTLIPIRQLQAIEEGNLEQLPEPIYIRGFIKQFADSLGLIGDDLANDFPTHLPMKQSKHRFGLRLPFFQLRPFHLYLFYILLVVLSVRGLSNFLQKSSSETVYQSQLQSPVVQPSSLKKPSPKPSSALTVAKKDPEKPVVVDIKLKDECWIKVVVDGKTQFEGVLPQGTHRTWEAKQQLTIRAGNAGGVLVAFNDQQAKQLGPRGQVQEVTFQANPKS